ncbi:unnamed protein product [Brassicogethes aeneus]|uniref:Peptidase metallopeptidase domain-containing protein n=1 Tax=Brassicogethes aeneus TaxID=1431903 RepID=A0A9P0AUP8_BRAAE|nr:unnamed protein product [Brassicogethes aeneus]
MKLIILVSCVVMCFNSVAFSASVDKLIFLQKYGYLDSTPTSPNKLSRLMNKKNYSEALKRFQKFYGLNATGIADTETLLAMNLPRCGVKDPNTSKQTRHKRYAVMDQPLWKKRDLTYNISKYSYHLDRNLVEREIERAFAEWSKYTDFTFTNSKNRNADIDIRFERRDHGDGDPFDGPGPELAHAEVKEDGTGLIHFDDDDNCGEDDGFFFKIVLHEIGHVLGLDHTNEEKSVMRPRADITYSELQSYDIQAIQDLYEYSDKNSDENLWLKKFFSWVLDESFN